MIPTTENIKEMQKQKLQVHKKISNSFIENAIANNNASALKIIYYLASEIESIESKEDYHTLTLDLKDMLRYTGLSQQNIRDNIKRMQQTSITFIDEENNIESGISLLPEYHFFWNKNRVDIVLNNKISKLIIEVTKQYTFINTKQLMSLKNKNSIRLLPLLHTINGYNKKQKTLTISELNAFFGTKYKAYELERSLISKVKEELDNNTSLTFEYDVNFETVGRGRPKATSITIIPKAKNNYQSTIFSNFEEEKPQEPQQTTKEKRELIFKEISEYLERVYTDKNIEREAYFAARLIDFVDYVESKDFKVKNITKSWEKHLEGYRAVNPQLPHF